MKTTMKTTKKINKKNWEGSDIFDRTSVSKAIPVDAKDGLIDIKWSENDRGYLVVFAPGSKDDVNDALKAFKKCGWFTEYETYKGYHVVCVRDKEWDGLTDESKKKPSPISIEVSEKQKEMRQLMNHLMSAEDEIYTAMTSADRMSKYEDNSEISESLGVCASYGETALKNLSSAKLAIRDIKMNESTKKSLVKEGAGAGYDITFDGLIIDKILDFKKSNETSKYREETIYEFVASLEPGKVDLECSDYYNQIIPDPRYGDIEWDFQVDGGKVYGTFTTWRAEGNEDSEDELIADVISEIEGSSLGQVSVMYGSGWVHCDLPEDGHMKFNDKNDNLRCSSVESGDFPGYVDTIEIDSKEITTAINDGFKYSDDEDLEEIDESLQDGFTINKEVTKKVDELVQAVWEDANREQKREAFHMFEKNLSKIIADYWDRVS